MSSAMCDGLMAFEVNCSPSNSSKLSIKSDSEFKKDSTYLYSRNKTFRRSGMFQSAHEAQDVMLTKVLTGQ